MTTPKELKQLTFFSENHRKMVISNLFNSDSVIVNPIKETATRLAVELLEFDLALESVTLDYDDSQLDDSVDLHQFEAQLSLSKEDVVSEFFDCLFYLRSLSIAFRVMMFENPEVFSEYEFLKILHLKEPSSFYQTDRDRLNDKVDYISNEFLFHLGFLVYDIKNLAMKTLNEFTNMKPHKFMGVSELDVIKLNKPAFFGLVKDVESLLLTIIKELSAKARVETSTQLSDLIESQFDRRNNYISTKYYNNNAAKQAKEDLLVKFIKHTDELV